jgi:branched-chain amino acid transport system ATP-binding protein
VIQTEKNDYILECNGVSKQFGGLTALSAVHLKVKPGQIVGVIGPNGAGKTTLFDMISGHQKATSGQIMFNGIDVTRQPPHIRARKGMGRTFQIVHPIPSLTVIENVMIGAFAAYGRRSAAAERAHEILEAVELSDRAQSMAGDLTLAGRKRLEVARAMAGNTSLLLLDEVMAGLNPVETGQAIAMIRRLSKRNVSIVLVEHNLKVVNELAEHAVVLDHGALIAEGSPRDVLKNPDVIRAYLGDRKVNK